MAAFFDQRSDFLDTSPIELVITLIIQGSSEICSVSPVCNCPVTFLIIGAHLGLQMEVFVSSFCGLEYKDAGDLGPLANWVRPSSTGEQLSHLLEPSPDSTNETKSGVAGQSQEQHAGALRNQYKVGTQESPSHKEGKGA